MEKNVNSLLFKAGLLRYQIEKEKNRKQSDPFVLLRLRRLLLLIEKKLKFPIATPQPRRRYLSPVPVLAPIRR